MLVHKGGKIKNWGVECRDVTPTNCSFKIYLKRALGGVGWRGQDGCECRIKVFVKIKKLKKNIFFFFKGGGGVGFRGVGLGGQGRCEQRSEVFVKNKQKIGGGVGPGGGVKVDVNKELKFL